MKKLIVGALIVSSLAGIASVHAQPTPPLTLMGNMTVQKDTGPVLNCALSIEFSAAPPPGYSPPGSVVASLVSNPGDPLCMGFQFAAPPYPVTYTGAWPDSFTVRNIYISTAFPNGDCAGDMLFTSFGGGIWTVDEIMSEVAFGTGDCVIAGAVL